MIANRLNELEQRYLWDKDYRGAPWWQRWLVGGARTTILLVRDFFDGDLNLRAMSLVYTTLLSLVPLLALSFSILKGFGVQNQLDDTLRSYLAPLGEEQASQITDNVIGFVDNMNVRVLGAVGLVFLVYTVISLMQKIEDAFNRAWRIPEQRSFGERFTTFVSALTVGPILIFAALAITGSVMNTAVMDQLHSFAVLGSVIDAGLRLVPFVLVIAAFTFLYSFIPNTRVKFPAALTGGVIAGILWEALSFGFASFAAGASKYQAVYATFASAILFMIWLYLNWLILLVGASVAFYRQHPEVVYMGKREIHLSHALIERYALALMARIGRRFYAGEPSPTLAELATECRVPGHALERVLGRLEGIGVLAHTDDEPHRYVPSVPLETTPVHRMLEQLADYQPADTYAPAPPAEPALEAIEGRWRDGRDGALEDVTLKDLASE